MARQEIILGTAPTGLGGDPPRTASQKINFMMQELYEGLATTDAPLPFTKGGTGAKTKAAAKMALDIVPVVDAADVTNGRLVTPGWMGLGNTGVQPALDTFFAHVPTGSYRCVGNTTIGSPVTSGSGGMVFAQRYSTTDTCYRVVFPGTGQSFEGYYNGSTLTWTDVYSGSNVGRGDNANGTYVKYPDGTLECWKVTGFLPHSAGTELITTWTLPTPAISVGGVPVVSINGPNNTQSYSIAKLAARVSSVSTVEIRSNLSTTQSYSFNLHFVGRWKA